MTPILGKSVATAEQMAAYLISQNVDPKISMEPVAFCRLYLYIAALEGVRGDALFAQSCWETACFAYGGTVTPEQNNYAGLGTTGVSEKGACFPDPATGILAQAQHAKSYATKDDLNYDCVDPRRTAWFVNTKGGTARHWEELGGTWAVPGYDTKKYTSLEAANAAKDSYGYKIMGILNKILGTGANQEPDTKTEQDISQEAIKIGKCILVRNDCYAAGRNIKPAGIVVHSTGANNPALRRYVQPDDGLIGVNGNNNDWNRPGIAKCVHAFIGKRADGTVAIYQTLSWTMRCWGCGSGSRGSYNNSHIQFEICEDALADAAYFAAAFEHAIGLCVYLCREYNIPVSEIVSHHEANSRGYASNHADCDHWLARFGKSMDWFRSQVWNRLGAVGEKECFPYRIKVANVPAGDALNIRKEPDARSEKTGEIAWNDPNTYTLIEEHNGWGKLKSGIGWISLRYTERV